MRPRLGRISRPAAAVPPASIGGRLRCATVAMKCLATRTGIRWSEWKVEVVVRPRGRRTTKMLQGAQERHQRRIVFPPPVVVTRGAESVRMCEYFRLPLEVDLRIDVGCIDGDVTEPRSDGVDVDAGAEQVRGCRMSDGVRADGSVQ